MAANVYITDVAGFLPNSPVGNEEIEQLLGMVGGKPSRARRIMLRNNGIKTRYYAIDPRTGSYTHNNAQMAAQAVRAVLERSRLGLDDVDLLACGTAGPDQIKPAHGHMVHGELGGAPLEIMTTAGVCTSGMTAMKFAFLSIVGGLARNAISTGSEFASSFMRAANFEPEIDAKIADVESRPELAFEKDFLRWMLSDGAGAALLADAPNSGRLSLRVDWIDGLSFAGEMPACMYSGAIKRPDGHLKGWREADRPQDVLTQGYFAVKQDARLLNEQILPVTVGRALPPIVRRHDLQARDVTWFLPHYSSEYFRQRLYDAMGACEFEIPMDRWFSNLTTKGNIGSAAIYLIIEELLYSGRLKKGDRLLCYIPESARFSVYYMHLTVV
ncbi:MAG: beta-ketoacyl-ACP synthase III [Acidiferrobacterales bacterium]